MLRQRNGTFYVALGAAGCVVPAGGPHSSCTCVLTRGWPAPGNTGFSNRGPKVGGYDVAAYNGFISIITMLLVGGWHTEPG